MFDDDDDEPAGFSDLSPDVQVQVLQFLPFRTRVRFERVCKNWAAILKYVWRSQKRLAICFANRYELDMCHDRNHRFALSDIVVDSNHSFVHYQRESFQIIKRCPNLIALYFSANQVATETFGNEISKLCPKLEHISVRDVTTFIAFASFPVLSRPNYIRCLHIDSDDQDADDDFDEDILCFAEGCPNLQSLSNFTNYNTLTIAEKVGPNLVEFKMGAVDDVVISLLVSVAKQLQRVAVKDSLDPESVQQILTLKHLEELELCASAASVRAITDSSIRFKALSLLSAETDPFTTADLRALLSLHGHSLKRLQVAGLKFVSNDFTMFAEYCLQLRSLHVLPSDPVTLTNASIQSLSQMRALRDVEIAACLITRNQTETLLNSWTRLKVISLINVPIATQIRDVLSTFARRYPRRQITAWLGYDDRPNADPPPRRRPDGRDSRVIRPPPGLSNIEVRGNLRIVYSH